MKKYLNTLYVTTQGSYLHKDGETILVKIEGEEKLRLPIHTISGIVCFGNVSVSPFLMAHCAEHSVGLSFLTDYGRFLARVHGKTSGNVLLRREQYRMADSSEACIKVARNIVAGKIANSRTVLQRAVRDHSHLKEKGDLVQAIGRLSYCIERLDRVESLDSLRGIEGEGGNIYFSVFDHLIVAQKDIFSFSERNRRPPRDMVNCLLSFFYTLVMNDIRSALEGVGLDSYVGFLHRDRSGRASLALDLMEEFRPFIADRLVLSLINRLQIKKEGFEQSAAGAVLMTDETRKTVLSAYQQRKQEEITHPYLNETVPLGLIFHLQALLLARFIRGDLDGYPVFIWK
jgi:CRISPR-associated protein Cas1